MGITAKQALAMPISEIAELHYLPEKTRRKKPNTVYGYSSSIRLHDIWVALGRPRGRIIGDARPSKVFRMLKKWAKKHRLPWVGMRNLRHTWGTIAAKHNPIEAVSAMMGHSNIQTTYRYYYQLTLATIRRVQRKVARSILGKTCDDMYQGIVISFPAPESIAMAA